MSYTVPADVQDSTQDQHDLAAAAIDAYCRRSFVGAVQFTLDGTDTDTLVVPLPILSLTAITAMYGSYDSEDIPLNTVAFSGQRLVRTDDYWPKGELNILVTGSFGYSPIPPLVIEASKRLVAKMVDETWEPGNFGTVKVGSVTFETGDPVQANIIGDPMIEAMLDPFVRKVRAIPI
jgi:hypothetical protein